MRYTLLLVVALIACGDASSQEFPTADASGPAFSRGSAIRCGDSRIMGTEACDDGNNTNSDGCSSTCAVESGYSCVGAPSVCRVDMPAGAVIAFDADYMASAQNNGGLANGDQVKTWKDLGTTGNATNNTSTNNYAAGAMIKGAETNHDAFYMGNSSVQMNLAGTQTSLATMSTTGVFDCFFAIRLAESGTFGSASPLLVDGGFKTMFYINQASGANNGKMSIIMNGGAVLKNDGPLVPLGAASVLEWEGDGANLKMRINNGSASTVAFAGSASPTTNLAFGADPSVTYFATSKTMREAYCYLTELSSQDRTTAVTHLTAGMDVGARSVIMAVGDSLTALGVNGTSKSWPQDLEVNLNAAHPRTYIVGNSGVAGDKVTDADSRMTRSVLGKANVSTVVFLIGGNDVIATSNSAAVIYGDTATAGTYKYMIHRCKTDSPTKKCYVASLIPFGGYSGWTQNRQDRYDALNTLLAADNEIDGFIDLWVVLRATTTGACAGGATASHTGACVMSTTTGCGGSSCDGTGESGLTPDGLHPGMAGEAAIASAVQTALGL